MFTSDENIIDRFMESNENKNILQSPKTKRIDQIKFNWPEVNKIIDNLVIRQLNLASEEEIEQTAEIYRLGFPELFAGVYEDVLFPGRYSKLGEHMKIFVVEDKGRIVSAWALTPIEKNMSLEFSLTATHPSRRGEGICKKFTKAMDELVEKTGAEYGFVYCASFHTATQQIFEKLGFKKEAELRGFILANAGEGSYARDNVVMYSKFYNGGNSLCPCEMKIAGAH